VEVGGVAELGAVEMGEFTTKDEVEQLWFARGGLTGHAGAPLNKG
jgi:hypothetical protein